MITTVDVTRRLRAEAARDSTLQRDFFSHSRAWWRDYVAADPAFRHRLVKLYAETESGQHRCSCASLVPLRAGASA